MADSLAQDEGAVGFLAVLERGAEREDEDENNEEEIAALACWRRHWRLTSSLSGEDGDF